MENTEDKRIQKLERKLRNYRIAVCILVLLLVAAVTFIIIIIKSENDSEEAFFGNINIGVNEEKTYKISDDLNAIAKDFNADGYVASVKTINGYEYLALTTEIDGESVDLCYQNEFPDKDKKDSIMKAIISKNGETLTIAEEYDITKPAGNLPRIVSFTDGSSGFLFIDEAEGMPSGLRLYNVTSMTKSGTIDMASTIKYYFELECGDEENSLVNVTQNGVTYTFETDNAFYSEAQEKGNAVLELSKDFKYSIDEDSLDLTAYISLGENAYIGEYQASITFSDIGFNMSSQRFEAYVSNDYEDYGNDRILSPRNEYINDAEKISIVGKNGGYYAFELYKNVPLNDYDFSRVSDDAKGIRSYSNENGEIISSFGIDVSRFQREIDWEKAAGQGVSFAIPRIAYRGYSVGAIVEDEYFEMNVENARAAGLDVGVYFFSQAITVEEGIEEAEFVIERIKDMNITGPIVFDTEYYDEPADARANLISREERTKITKAFCETIEAAGYKPMVYANTRWMLLGIDLDELAEYDFWYAYYGKDPILPYDFAIWQYSSEGRIEGVEGQVDMNIMFRDVFNEKNMR